ncbi:MAG: glycosyltransferase family 4 protein [Patescibacteria group bacterium]
MIGQKGIPAHSGGIERHVEELSTELSALGHEVLVFCRTWYTPSDMTLHRGVKLIFAPTIRTKHLDAIVHTFSSIIKAIRMKADVIHIHGVGPSLLAWLPKLLRPSTKVVVTFHCIDRHHQKWNGIARAMLHLGEITSCKLPDATVTVAKTLQTYCRLSYGIDTIYIPNGTQIPMEQSNNDLLKPFKLETDKYILFCARLVKHKGAHILMDAWQKLRTQNPELTDGIKLAVVGGTAFTDEYVKELRRRAEQDDSIVMTGVQTGETLHALFANCSALVHPSESEGLPIAVLEGMGYAKCVLASNIPENMELVQEHGMNYQVGNTDDLIEKIKEILSHKEHAQALGQEARAHVAQNYDWKEIAQTTSYLYEMLQSQINLETVQSGQTVK